MINNLALPATPSGAEIKNEAKAQPVTEAPASAAEETPPPIVDVHAISQSIRRDVEEEYAEKWRVIGALLSEATKLKAHALQESESIILRLAFEISKKIVRCEARINPEVFVENLRETLRRLQPAETLTVWMNPRDLERLENNEVMKNELGSKAPQFKLKPRPDIEPGGCLFESDAGTIDATIESQLAELERLLNEINA